MDKVWGFIEIYRVVWVRGIRRLGSGGVLQSVSGQSLRLEAFVNFVSALVCRVWGSRGQGSNDHRFSGCIPRSVQGS